MARKPVPLKLQHKLLYDAEYVCCVCQRGGCQIHHIDGDHANNVEDNLIVLCTAHHDEAHTKRELSKNLGPAALRDAKRKWLATVAERRREGATLAGQLVSAHPVLAVGVTWGYINHARVAQIARPDLLADRERRYFDQCVSAGLIDSHGVLVKPASVTPSGSYIRSSVYDWYAFGDDQRIHKVYASLVDQISRAVTPVHLGPENWTKAQITDLVKPGDFIYVERGFHFKTLEETSDNQHRRVQAIARKVRVEFFIETRDMFGTTSMTVSFFGHQHCAALVQVKTIAEDVAGVLVLTCTPIALGVGFRSKRPSEENAS
jgi:hypothetical protein